MKFVVARKGISADQVSTCVDKCSDPICNDIALKFQIFQRLHKFLDVCIEDDKPKFAVLKRNNYFTDMDGNPYNFSKDLKTMDTKAVEPVYEFAHALYFYKKSYFLEHGKYWDWSDVRYIEIEDGIEVFDIDTEEQFLMAEAMWKGLNLKNRKNSNID